MSTKSMSITEAQALVRETEERIFLAIKQGVDDVEQRTGFRVHAVDVTTIQCTDVGAHHGRTVVTRVDLDVRL